MTDDGIALLGCAIAFGLAGGFVGIVYPIGQAIRQRNRPRSERRSVPFQVTETASPEAAESERRAA